MKTEYKNIKAENEAITRNLHSFDKDTQNIYEAVYIISKRANQIAAEIKDELNEKIREFASSTDNLDEVFENREQIEWAKYYEQIPKPTLLAIKEFEDGQVYYQKHSNEESL